MLKTLLLDLPAIKEDVLIWHDADTLVATDSAFLVIGFTAFARFPVGFKMDAISCGSMGVGFMGSSSSSSSKSG